MWSLIIPLLFFQFVELYNAFTFSKLSLLRKISHRNLNANKFTAYSLEYNLGDISYQSPVDFIDLITSFVSIFQLEIYFKDNNRLEGRWFENFKKLYNGNITTDTDNQNDNFLQFVKAIISADVEKMLMPFLL